MRRDGNVLELRTNEDVRGKLSEIIRSDEIKKQINQVYFTTTKPNAVRGNHVHKRKTEWFCVVQGEALLLLRYPEGKQEELMLSSNKMMLIEIPPGVAHAIKNTGKSDMHLLSAVDEVYNPENSDTFPILLL